MNNKLKVVSLLLILCCTVMLFFTGCSQDNTQSDQNNTKTVTDEGGNTVELPDSITKVAITPIPWASAMYAIDGSSKRIVSINPSAMAQYNKSFMKTMDPDFANISTGEITKDFTINIESLLNLSPEVAFIWNDQTDEAEQLKKVGITPVMLNYAENLDDLKKDIKLMGEVLDQNEKASTIIEYQDQTDEYFNNAAEKLKSVDQPKVLYLQNSSLSVAGSKNINNTLLAMTGAQNAAGELDKKWAQVNMEQIMAWDPDIIYLSNFDDTQPDDLYENKIEGQDWSSIKAVKNHRVYKTPVGLLRWDAPCVETPLMLKWMAKIQQPDLFKDLDVKNDIKSYYKKILNYDLTDDDVNTILNTSVNGDVIN
ncbi:MAG: ABC transporter substrate-binding protein [Eubacteriaceae bacterium]